ncbi:MAG: IS1-like element transposase [Defluviitaleaceae bacterium]|nr:IS1-like element transposase [Defluviitaleaceae bacterium]
MSKIKIKCIYCNSEKVSKNGKNPKGIQTLLCRNCNKRFQAEYSNNGSKPETKRLIIEMSLNGSGIRDISRVLKISTNTVLSVLKKEKTH